MARSIQIATDVEELAEEIEAGERPEEAALDILAELGATPGDDNWRFTVSHVLGSSRDGVKEPQIYEGDASIIEGLHTRLREEFGGGRFRVRVYKNKRLYRRQDIEVASPPRPTQQAAPQSDMTAVLAAMERQNQSMREMFQQFLTTQKPLAPALPVNPFEGIQQIAATMSSLSQMFMPKTDPTMTTVDALLKGVELAAKVRGDDGGGDDGDVSLMAVVRDVIKGPIGEKIGEVVASQMTLGQMQKPLPKAVRLPPKEKTATPQEQPAPVQEPDANATAQNFLRKEILYLVTRAQNNSDPIQYAEWVMDNWPRELLINVTATPNLLAVMNAQVPETVPYTGWFKQLIDELGELVKDAIEAEKEITPDAPGAPASTVNPDGNPGGGGRRQDNASAHVETGADGEEEPNN